MGHSKAIGVEQSIQPRLDRRRPKIVKINQSDLRIASFRDLRSRAPKMHILALRYI